MSRLQGDGWITHTDYELNDYRDNVFYPTLIKLIDEKKQIYDLGNDLTIVTYEKNKVHHIGFKLKSLKIIGRRYCIYLYQDYGKSNQELLTYSVIDDDKDKANQEFIRIKSMAY